MSDPAPKIQGQCPAGLHTGPRMQREEGKGKEADNQQRDAPLPGNRGVVPRAHGSPALVSMPQGSGSHRHRRPSGSRLFAHTQHPASIGAPDTPPSKGAPDTPASIGAYRGTGHPRLYRGTGHAPLPSRSIGTPDTSPCSHALQCAVSLWWEGEGVRTSRRNTGPPSMLGGINRT